MGEPIDIAHGVPSTAEDIEMLLRLWRDTPSWFSLSPDEIEALIPEGALDRRPAMKPDARPFELP